MHDVLDAVLSIFECDRAVLGRHSGKPVTRSFTLLAKRERAGFALDFGRSRARGRPGFPRDERRAGAVDGPVQWVLGSVPPGLARFLTGFGVQSALSMPIEPKIERPDWIFVFTVRQCTHPRLWTPEEVRLFQEIGRRFGDAVLTLSELHDPGRARLGCRKARSRARRLVGARLRDRPRIAFRRGVPDIRRRPVDLLHWQERWPSLIHPDDRQNTAQASVTAFRGGPRYDVEYRVVRPDERCAWCTARAM